MENTYCYIGKRFQPVYSQTEWNHAYVDMSRIYMITLAKETPSPLLPKTMVKVERKRKIKDAADEKVKEKVDL